MKRTLYVVMALTVLAVTGCSGVLPSPEQPEQPEQPTPVSDPKAAELVALMGEIMKRHDIGAGVLAVMRDGDITFDRAFGWKDEARSVELPQDVLMRIASINKPITAAAIRRLILTGRLRLDDRAFDLGQAGGGILSIQPFPSLDDARLADITVEHLLLHQGGWDYQPGGTGRDLMFIEIEIANAMGIDSPPSREDTLRYVLGQPLQFDPGTKTRYANVGFMILGLIVEEVAGVDYMDYIHDAVFAPLGVHRADVILGRTFAEDHDAREPWYDGDGANWINVFDPTGSRVPAPYGGWHHELHISSGGLAATARALLLFSEEYMVAGPHIGMLRTTEISGSWYHFGSLPGTLTVLRQSEVGINYAVMFNRERSGGTYIDLGEIASSLSEVVGVESTNAAMNYSNAAEHPRYHQKVWK